MLAIKTENSEVNIILLNAKMCLSSNFSAVWRKFFFFSILINAKSSTEIHLGKLDLTSMDPIS